MVLVLVVFLYFLRVLCIAWCSQKNEFCLRILQVKEKKRTHTNRKTQTNKKKELEEKSTYKISYAF